MSKIQTLLTTTVLLFGMNVSVIAGFNDGWVAYEKGDYKTAFNEWKPLAEQGDIEAQYNLGWAYVNGEGVLKDDKEAVKWYRKAAEQGYAKAQSNLGWAYENGRGVLKSYRKAYRWYAKAADQDLPEAQLDIVRLTIMAVEGEIVTGKVLTEEDKRKGFEKLAKRISSVYENERATDKMREEAQELWDKYELHNY